MIKFINMIRDKRGASAAEYALLLALIGVGIAIAAFQLGGAIQSELSCAETIIETKSGVSPTAC